MASLSTTLSVLLAVVAGAALIHLVSGVQRRFRGNTNAADLFDALVPSDAARYRDLVWIAIPPVVGGMLLAFWPGTNGGVAGAAGLFAAFLSVWPFYRFPLQLLPEDLQPFWPRLKVLYSLFVGMSAALTYLGFIIVDRILPVAGTLARAQRWVQILDRLSASAIYGPAKYGLATLLVIGGMYFNRERVRIGERAHGLKHKLVIGEPSHHPNSRDA
jgi:hypothetical protein